MPASGTHLRRRKPTVHADRPFAVSLGFFFEHPNSHADTGVAQAAGKAVVLNHAAQVQILDADHVEFSHKRFVVPDEVVVRHGVKIMGYSNTPAHLAADASALFARNLYNFLSAFWDKETGRPVLDEEIGDAVRLTRGGKVVNQRLLG